MAATLTHLDTVEFLEPPADVAGCEECLKIGGAIGHPIMRSVEPGEDWSWCTVDEIGFVLRP